MIINKVVWNIYVFQLNVCVFEYVSMYAEWCMCSRCSEDDYEKCPNFPAQQTQICFCDNTKYIDLWTKYKHGIHAHGDIEYINHNIRRKWQRKQSQISCLYHYSRDSKVNDALTLTSK